MTLCITKKKILNDCKVQDTTHHVAIKLDYYGLFCYDNRQNKQWKGNQSSSEASLTPLFTPIPKR